MRKEAMQRQKEWIASAKRAMSSTGTQSLKGESAIARQPAPLVLLTLIYNFVMRVLAAIDAGSNAVRMLVAEVSGAGGGRFHRLRYERRTTRLAEDIERTGNLSPESMERTVFALRDYRRILASYPVSGLRAVGTSAIREAANGGLFIGRVLEETGIRLEAISHEEESRLSAMGVTGFLDISRSFILDIGGGSTEWMIAEGRKLLRSGSIPVGVVKLLELHGEDGLRGRIEATARKLKEAVGPLPAGAVFVITGGAASTAASIDLGLARYEHEKVHGHEMDIPRLREIYRRLEPMTPDERKTVPGLEPDRADLIVPGLGLIINIMGEFGLQRLVASDTGLPEGLVLEILEGNADAGGPL